MANPEHVAILRQGVTAWNAWMKDCLDREPVLEYATLADVPVPTVTADLRGLNLKGMPLMGTNFTRTDLSGSDLSATNLAFADLHNADLSGVSLRRAWLATADLTAADLHETDLSFAELSFVNFRLADLSGADLTGAFLQETLFVDTNLTAAKGLATCRHLAPSTVDHRTLAMSGKLPLTFLRGVGLPERLIAYLPSLLDEAIQFCACFISYSSKDQPFAKRLLADLQDNGVRCWFAPHDLPIGAKTRPTIDEAIREYDKLLLVLSKHSVESAWVEHEIERALAKELRTRTVVLFPVRLDDAIMSATTTWAREIREDRNIGDLRRWRSQTAYQTGFERLLRDLRTEQTVPPLV